MYVLASTAGAVLVAITTCVLVHFVLAWATKFLATKSWLRKSSIPGPPRTNWLLGHVATMLSDSVHLQMAEWTNSYGPIFKLQLLNKACVVVTDPAAVHTIIRWPSSPAYLTKDPEVYGALEMSTEPRLQNILTSKDDPYWKAVRQATAPCFSITNLKQVHPWVQHLCSKAINHARGAGSSSTVATAAAAAAAAQADGSAASHSVGEIDIGDLCKRFTADVIGRMLFAEDLGSMDMKNSSYLEAFANLLEELHAHFSNPLRPFILKFMIWRKDVQQGLCALKTHDQLLQQKLEALLVTPPPEYSITSHLFKMRDPATGQPLSPGQLKQEMAIMMGAGFETTSHSLTWTLAALATHPDVQETLAAELAGAAAAAAAAAESDVPSPDKQLAWADLCALPYLNAVLKESLRLFSPISLGSFRYCHKDIELLGHRVPQGALVIIPMYPIGVSSHNYGPTANQFIPERWLEPHQVQQLRSAAGLQSTKVTSLSQQGSTAAGKQEVRGVHDAATADKDSCLRNSNGWHSSRESDSSGTSSGHSGMLPDPLSFSVGPRDCIGQMLAKMELQSLVAALVSQFKLEPGAELQQQLRSAAAAAAAAATGKGSVPEQAAVQQSDQVAVAVLLQNSVYHVTMQPRSALMLKFTPRSHNKHGAQ